MIGGRRGRGHVSCDRRMAVVSCGMLPTTSTYNQVYSLDGNATKVFDLDG